MTRVLLATVRLLEFLEGGGHFWAYMQYAQALRQLGCEIYLLDSSMWSDEAPDAGRTRAFLERLARYGLEDRVIVAANSAGRARRNVVDTDFGVPESEFQDLLESVDLLLNFNYHLSQEIVSAVRRSALVDIDPGLLQYWISDGLIFPAVHDLYFTTGERIGRRSASIPDCGVDWLQIRPPVCLELWPYTHDPKAEAFTTVSSWRSDRDYVGDSDGYYDNSKRTAFLEFIDLPRHTQQPLELALFLAESDDAERRTLESCGWRVRHSLEVAGNPESYRAYVQQSRGEFSCAKASYIRFQNAWVSDRSLCYLASGKPVVVQHTGPSSFLPDGEGIFRFRALPDAVQALESINADYERQCRLARRLAEEHFDAKAVVGRILELAL